MNDYNEPTLEETNETKLKVDSEIGFKEKALRAKRFETEVAFICKMMNKTKVLSFKHAIEMLRKTFQLSVEDARKVVYQGEYDYRYLITADQYLIDNDLYVNLTEDVFMDNIRLNEFAGKCPIPFYSLLSKEDKETLSCLSIIANYMPYSQNFSIVNYPFNATFTIDNITGDEENRRGCVYELIYLDSENIKTKLVTLRECYRVPKEYQLYLKRFAIVDDRVDISEIDYIGFERIFSVSKDGMIEVLEERDNPWEI